MKQLGRRLVRYAGEANERGLPQNQGARLKSSALISQAELEVYGAQRTCPDARGAPSLSVGQVKGLR